MDKKKRDASLKYLYLQGYNFAEIGRKLGMSGWMVSKTLKAGGLSDDDVKVHNQSRKALKGQVIEDPPEFEDTEDITYWVYNLYILENCTIEQISDEVGLCDKTVRKILKTFGVDTRKPAYYRFLCLEARGKSFDEIVESLDTTRRNLLEVLKRTDPERYDKYKIKHKPQDIDT